MGLVQRTLRFREVLGQLPSYLFHLLFSCLYSTAILRTKAAATAYPMIRKLLMKRSGIRVGRDVTLNFGDLVMGGVRKPCCLTLGDRADTVLFEPAARPADNGHNYSVRKEFLAETEKHLDRLRC